MSSKIDKLLRIVEPTFTVLALIQYSADWMPLILSGGVSEGDGVDINSFNFTLNVLTYLLTYMISGFLLLLRWKKVVYFISKDRIVWVLVGIAIASVLWSFSPARTLKSCIGLIGTTFFGLYLGTRYSIRDQVKLLGLAYGLIIVFSILFAIGLPRYGIMGGVHAGAWRGIFTHKNFFGRALAFSGVLFAILTNINTQKKWLPWLGIVAVMGLLVLAKSTTSMINFVVLIGSLYAYRVLRLRYFLMIPGFFAIVAIGGVVIDWYTQNATAILGTVGKDPSLTGRTDLWAWVGEMIDKRPILGYGYTAFWNGLDGPSAYIVRAARWPVPYSHNGLLDLWLDIGLLGVSAYLLGFGLNLLRAVWWARFSLGFDGLWPLVYLTYTVLSNLTEGGIMAQNGIFWVLYTTLSISLVASPEHPHEAKVKGMLNSHSKA